MAPSKNPAASEIAGSSSSGDTSSTLESQKKESIATAWTNEKHSLYLKSMEASFLDQLYSSSAFKVLQDGCWSKISFRKDKSQTSHGNKSCDLETNPWIQHFRHGSTQQAVASHSTEEKPVSTTAPAQFTVSHDYLCWRDSIDSHAEVTAQNFVNEDVVGEEPNRGNIEDVAGEEPSRGNIAKRMKTAVVSGRTSDQVVPSETFST